MPRPRLIVCLIVWVALIGPVRPTSQLYTPLAHDAKSLTKQQLLKEKALAAREVAEATALATADAEQDDSAHHGVCADSRADCAGAVPAGGCIESNGTLWSVCAATCAARHPPFVPHRRATAGGVLPVEIYPAYPLDEAAVARGRSGFAGADRNKLQRAVRAASRGERLRVVVLGGSITARCKLPGEHNHSRSCAWPSRLEDWLRRAHPASAPEVINAAVPATSSRMTSPNVHKLVPANADIVLTDFVVNDAHLVQKQGSRPVAMLWRRVAEHVPSAAVLPLTVACVTGWQTPPADVPQYSCLKCAFYGEQRFAPSSSFVKWVQTNESHTPNEGSRDCYNMAKGQEAVAVQMRLPFVSYRSAAWPNGNLPPRRPVWTGNRHLHHPTHVLIADVVAAAWHAEIPAAFGCARAEPSETNDNTALSEIDDARLAETTTEGCAEPQTLLSAHFPPFPAVPVLPAPAGGGWAFTEDVPGKPGWIGHGEPSGGAEIVFRLNVSRATPTIEVGFLRSYESVGAAVLWLGGAAGVAGADREGVKCAEAVVAGDCARDPARLYAECPESCLYPAVAVAATGTAEAAGAAAAAETAAAATPAAVVDAASLLGRRELNHNYTRSALTRRRTTSRSRNGANGALRRARANEAASKLEAEFLIASLKGGTERSYAARESDFSSHAAAVDSGAVVTTPVLVLDALWDEHISTEELVTWRPPGAAAVGGAFAAENEIMEWPNEVMERDLHVRLLPLGEPPRAQKFKLVHFSSC